MFDQLAMCKEKEGKLKRRVLWDILECSLLLVQFYLLSPPPALNEGRDKTTEVP